MKQAVHFGAGNIGRGFIGAILSKAGYQVTFVDVNKAVIDELNEKGSYTVQIASAEQASFVVENVSGIHSSSEHERLNETIAKASLITASVGPNILTHIAKDIAAGLAYAEEQSMLKELNVVACENMIQATDFLRGEIEGHLNDTIKERVLSKVGFPNSAVDRIVPIQHHDDLLTVQVEPFFEWVVEEPSWKGSIPNMEGVQFVEDLSPFIERKLLTVNTGHAAIAYIGLQEGYVTVDRAMENAAIKEKVEQVLSETSEFLVGKYELDPEQHKAYVNKIISRFENPYLSDELSRVGRSPLRKLSAKERLVYPARALMEQGREPNALIDTIAAALHFKNEEDQEAIALQAAIEEHGVKKAFADAADLPEDDVLVVAVVRKYAAAVR
ncbi:mannitol-1-phosphate 5-dehydrogenase [Jeotgalibacillus soli]|uniref:Mannitol-1-phosphate 5-dehydrogenase n=1 Tax=Jeotgalibacillus soli TaxID=889306 RepID=A0A0C2SDY8_9BACL|nr:mannitol-1-phosphate 5-dehydrogenase [Jeotgalibacillus soli]KIL52169.1 mannitol-1-phosphate 5-dehydrogenase [Jeotgalibacillus soli]